MSPTISKKVFFLAYGGEEFVMKFKHGGGTGGKQQEQQEERSDNHCSKRLFLLARLHTRKDFSKFSLCFLHFVLQPGIVF